MFKLVFIALISSVILQPALAQFADPEFFLENVFAIPPKPEYDVEGSQCDVDSECEASATKRCNDKFKAGSEKEKRCLEEVQNSITEAPDPTYNARVICGLVEVYQITSVNVAQFVPTTRHKLCVPKHRCNR